MTNVIKLVDAEAVSQKAKDMWIKIADEAINSRGSFSVAVSGGKTPRRLYQLMAGESTLDWEKCFVFFGDERRVSPIHDDSSYRMVKELLFDHVPLPPEHIFPMQGVGLASFAVREYEGQLRRHFHLERGDWPSFDLVLLGMGADGHIASIFPGTRAVSDLTNMAVVYEVPKLHKERMTLTTPVFCNARHLAFLVTGEEKAEALAATLEGNYQPSTYPAQALQPKGGGEFVWLVDKAAAAQLKKS